MEIAAEAKMALEILERAMAIEREGRRFYLKAARATGDKKGQEMFRTLANDEQSHLELIRKQHTSLSSQQQWNADAGAELVSSGGVDLDKPLFPRGLGALKKTATVSSDSDALLFGLDIEMKSFDFYRKAAAETGDPLGKQMFQFLARQEQSHFDVLMMRYDSLFGPISWQY